ncbi:CU044_2847 family protein [Streptomyces violens]|uniref:CU044_2847 family protein n=1 Tax=Streptomyces violens TaxID=66377 RepID=UPI0004C059BF|nr:CU044_2847 family protein [Streptomyces violens]
MPEYAELQLSDRTLVRLALAPVGTPAPAVPAARPDLPDGAGTVEPVGRARERVAALAGDGLRAVLSPLGPLLQEVHDSVVRTENPPQELSVEFGVQIGQDLKLGIAGGSTQAAMKITASWQLPDTASQEG